MTTTRSLAALLEGHHGLRSLLLGSVSHHVVHHARRPVLVIPSPTRITARGRATSAVPPVEESAVSVG